MEKEEKSPPPLRSGGVALVTGGASGIGLGIAQALAEQGMQVVIADIREDHIDHARAELSPYGDQLDFQLLDVTDRGAWASLGRRVEERYGGLDILCLNAGVGILGTILASREDDWDWLVGVNLGGVLNGVAEFLPRMRARGTGGHIMATSSMGGMVVANEGGIYSSAKFGVVALMECLRADLEGEEIGVSVLCPAAVNTNIFDHARMRPENLQNTGLNLSEAELEQQEAMARQILAMGKSPLEVGHIVVDAIRANDPYIFTDGRVKVHLQPRHKALLASN